MRLLTVSLLFAASSALASPITASHQGRLLDPAGGPLNGTVDVAFALHESSMDDSPLWTETATLVVQDGFYGWTLGSTNSLDSDLFGSEARWLEVSVDGVVMGRQPWNPAPYAVQSGTALSVDGGVVNASQVQIDGSVVIDGSGAFVGDTSTQQARVTGTCPAGQHITGINADGSVTCASLYPTGLVGYFAGGCPTGFSAYEEAAGRAVVGTPSGGDSEATVGAALTNQGLRTIAEVAFHQHAVDPPNAAVADGGVHNHAASSGTTGNHGHSASSGTTGSHNHSGSTSTAGNHDHAWRTANHDRNDSASQGYPAGNNHVAFRSTDRNQRAGSTSAITDAGNHTHSLSINSNGNHAHTVSVNSAGNHAHSVTVNNAAAHGHTVDIPAFNTSPTGAGTVDVTMPYIQLTACIAD